MLKRRKLINFHNWIVDAERILSTNYIVFIVNDAMLFRNYAITHTSREHDNFY